MALTTEQKIEEIALSYQQGKIDAQGVKDQITQLKSQYPKDAALLDKYLNCFESQNYPSICLAEIEAGKTASPGTPPSDKGRFYQLLKPYVKNNPQSQDALDELLVFSDVNDINYAEYLELIKGAQTTFGLPGDNLEDIVRNLDIKAILFQCLSLAAILKLKKLPPLTSIQISKLPAGLKLYYQEYENTVIPALKNWKILPGPGSLENAEKSGAVAFYSTSQNKFRSPSTNPLLSLYKTVDIETIYHEIFHAYQDAKSIQQNPIINEAHANLVGRMCTLRVLEITSTNSQSKMDALENAERERQTRNGTTEDDINFNLQYWDWAYSTLNGTLTTTQANDYYLFTYERHKKATGVNLYNSLMQEQTDALSPNIQNFPIYITQIETQIAATDLQVAGLYTEMGINASDTDRDSKALAYFKQKSQVFLKDDGKYEKRISEENKKDYELFQNYLNYIIYRSTLLYLRFVISESTRTLLTSSNLPSFQDFQNSIALPICEIAALIIPVGNNGF